MWKWFIEQAVEGIVKRQTLFSDRNDKNLWRFMVAHVVNRHGTVKKSSELSLHVESVLAKR